MASAIAVGVRVARRVAVVVAALAIGAAAWLPLLHRFFEPSEADVASPSTSRIASGMLAEQLGVWEDDARRHELLARMRLTNPEWDFMGRTFVAMALINEALRDARSADRYLAVVDRIIDDTEARIDEHGAEYFLLPYAERGAWQVTPRRSVFIDGELAWVLAARQLAKRDDDRLPRLHVHLDAIVERMAQGFVVSAESYPDECWTFCNTVALAALRVADVALGEDHAALRARWVESAKRRLVDPATGLLVSSYRYDGTHLDGPEGSSIFMVAHDLMFVDEAFARDQWARAKKELDKELFGFAWAREWPARAKKRGVDVDSGPIVPFVEASAGASGMAVLGAATFEDRTMLRGLLASMGLAAFPIDRGGARRYAASNQVGDAVVLYAMLEGPVLARVRSGK
jgi:hypothetical protein